jgi:uncharacterized protein
LSGAPPARRAITIDAVRGFAVLGILLMNIVAFGMPDYAYVDPRYYGTHGPGDLAAWALAYVFADGKMRALFTMLFGASMLIAADAAEDGGSRAAVLHYRRMAWLLVFGMIHAWLFWYGDILVEYAIAGAIAFAARRWPPRAICFAALMLIGWELIMNGLIPWLDMTRLRDLAARDDAPAAAVRAWNGVMARVTPEAGVIERELRLYRGDFGDAFAARAPLVRQLQTQLMPGWIPGAIGTMLLGMWLHRLGFWTGGWQARSYRRLVGCGALALLLTVPIAAMLVRHEWDPALLPLADMLGLPLRFCVALGYASALILLVRSTRMPTLVARFAVVGRMALTNYLGTTLIATTLFYGYGFGLFGWLSRAELYGVVVMIWLFILAWSPVWLRRHRYGPAEWLWRSLTRASLQPMRKS